MQLHNKPVFIINNITTTDEQKYLMLKNISLSKIIWVCCNWCWWRVGRVARVKWKSYNLDCVLITESSYFWPPHTTHPVYLIIPGLEGVWHSRLVWMMVIWNIVAHYELVAQVCLIMWTLTHLINTCRASVNNHVNCPWCTLTITYPFRIPSAD